MDRSLKAAGRSSPSKKREKKEIKKDNFFTSDSTQKVIEAID